MSDKKINKESVLMDIVSKKGANAVLANNKVPCITCPMAKMEMETLTLGQICNMYGLDLEKIIKELNELKE